MTDQHASVEKLLAKAEHWMNADIGWEASMPMDERFARRAAETATAQVHATLALADAVTDLMAVVETMRSDTASIAAGLSSEARLDKTMSDFHRRSACHIAEKRDVAEAAVESWERGEVSADAALLIVKKALAVGPVDEAGTS